ncbi:hypothetical protein K492DRAFT_214110 [Lichtheimia hyalospora FSU 10163]|nr:hypothetical protein K492DRAFT_214110 [Lichtheimia hyalospora FSU 10163]
MTLPEFRSRYGQLDDIALTDADIWLLVRYLHTELGVAVADNVKGYGTEYVVVKFPAKDEKAEITQHDRALVSMKTTCHALKVQVDELQFKAEELATMAHEHYRAKRKAQALYAHKRKKHIMEILDRRLRSLETMEMMLLKIETSQNDLQVVRAFNMGADALQSILSKEDLSLATVDEAMFKVQKAFEDQKEVEDAIVMGTEEANNRVSELDDDELEKELEDLQREEIAVQQEQEQRPPLRQVTQSAPPPDRSESELARINNLFQQLRKTDTPPTTTPRLQQPKQKMLAE